MKNLLIALMSLISLLAHPQVRDLRAELDIEGRVNEISVSPDGKIWLVTALGSLYYTTGIDSNWHKVEKTSDKTEAITFSSGEPHLERVSFFNKDTAVITGYISSTSGYSPKDGYYMTQDGGKTWQLKSYGGNDWIYDAYVSPTGKIWMGGSSGKIFYSQNFGFSWDTLHSPFDGSSRMHSIFMLTDQKGISGALFNEIYSTDNNWTTRHKVITPFDQKKYAHDEGHYSDNRIGKIILFNGYIVVNQNGHVFYSDEREINWKKFPIDIIDFDIDQIRSKLFAITADLKMVEFSNPLEYEMLSNIQLKKRPMDTKLVNATLYLIDGEDKISKVSNRTLVNIGLYTTDHKINGIKIVAQAPTLTWGGKSHNLYISDNEGKDWYRESVCDFSIISIRALGDTAAIIWDGIQSHLYTLRDHSIQLYQLHFPLRDFLKVPISNFVIESGSQGCFHGFSNYVSFENVLNSTLTVKECVTAGNQMNRDPLYRKSVKAQQLFELLAAIDSAPGALPALADFQISEKDKEKYRAMIKEETKTKDAQANTKKLDMGFYMQILSMLDTLPVSLIGEILDKPEGIWSTTSNWFGVHLVNENNDTLHISRQFYASSPWNLPWQINYKGTHFISHDIRFSRFVGSCIPEDFLDRGIFDNSLFIREIAEYLDKKRRQY